MIIGVPRETHRHENRVGLTPFAVMRLLQQGHAVMVEKSAGLASHFADRNYEAAGAKIVYSSEEVYKRADLVCRVSVLSPEEIELIRPGLTICGFMHLAVAPRGFTHRLMELETTVIGYEIVRDQNGDLPVLLPFSEMCGQMAIHIAAQYLQNQTGGRGVLIGNVAGVPPPTILILGAGGVGHAAARQALASGAHVVVIDIDIAKLRAMNREFRGQIVTVLAGLDRLEKYTAIADVVIGAVLIPGARAPFLVTEDMVKGMKPGSVIIDASIDQGGCVETSRPMSIDNPVFVAHGVVHYCVPNMTANVARTASRALASTALPYVQAIVDKGLEQALAGDKGLADGVYLYKGRLVNQGLADILHAPASPIQSLIQEGEKA